MTHDLSHQPVARDNVALNNLPETLEGVVANLQSVADGGAFFFVLFGDVNVDILLLPELPGKSEAVLAPRRWTEEEVALAELAKLRYRSTRTNILEFLVSNCPWDESTSLLPNIFSEVVVDQITSVNLVWIDTKTLSEAGCVCLMRGKVFFLAPQNDLKFLFVLVVDSIDAALQNLSFADLVVQGLSPIVIDEVACLRDSSEAVVQETEGD